ncbi:histidinol-phosphatase [Roseinatronobacter monicus]|uniref:Histidinol-phosphatase n=1 Tax=Roseinatronobacter monicus TaxID=393481 RepID=A0A543KCK8_9RHOB|nr:histidinol-phosphatase [Roseinatronobacter monicus]TQM92823.1 histidinol phosphatase-like enzyme (inositol monophosphatase family) [Roseinatronobacter monicus]
MPDDRRTLSQHAVVLEQIETLADLAREAILPWFRSPELGAANKTAEGFDPVTQADRAAEQALRAYLQEARPLDGILGEEFGPKASQSGLTWVIDPIDGTRGFLAGTPCWGVLIALADVDGPFLGVIDQPYISERFLGGLGQAWVDGPQGRKALATRTTPNLGDAILFTTFPEIGTTAEQAAFKRVEQNVRLTRYGMDCYAYALLAAGHVDLVIEAGLNPYDIAAPIAVIEAAGGIVTDWHGARVGENGQVIAAANAELHAQALALLRG